MFSISSQLDSIFVRSHFTAAEPTNEFQHSQISCGPRSGKYNSMYVEFQSIFDRIIPTATKGKNQMAIYLTNGQKLCFPVCIVFNCIMGESRTFSLPGQYLCKCIKNKQRFLRKNEVQFHRIGLHCLHCLQVAITAPERGPITHPAQEG